MKKLILMISLLIISVLLQAEYKIIKAESGEELTFSQLIHDLARKDVVFFGELHDEDLLHQIKYDIFERLTRIDSNFVLGMESFARNDQDIVDDFVKGNYSFEQLDAHANLWSNYTSAYQKIVEFSQKENIKILATNTPIYISGMVAKQGLEALSSLPKSDRGYYARVTKPFANDYKQLFIDEIKEASENSLEQVNPLLIENLYQAHSLKDDTMAETIFEYLEDNHRGKVFHINGDFHTRNHYGIYQKLELLNPNLELASISPMYFPSDQSLEWSYDMYGRSEYIIMYHRDQESSIINDKADTSEFLRIDKHNISFIFEPSAQVLTVSDRITFNQNPNVTELLISKDMKQVQVMKGKDKLDIEIEEYNKLFNRVSFTSQEKDLTFVYIYDYPKSEERPYNFHLEEYMWHPVVNIGEKSYFEVNALGPNKMKFIAPAEATISPQRRDAIYYSWKSYEKEYGFSIVGDIYFTKSLEIDDVLVTIYSFEDEYYLLDEYAYQIEQYFEDYKHYFGKLGYETFSIVQSANQKYKSFDNMLLVNNSVFKREEIFLSPGVLGHDLAKLWIASKTGWDQRDANWQEMLANFISNYYWLEKNKPEEAYLWRKDALEEINSLPREEYQDLNDFKFTEDKFSAVNGYKISGMLYYYMYNKAGSGSFFTAIRDILADNSVLSGNDFHNTLMDKTGAREVKTMMEDKYPVRVYIQEATRKDGKTRVKIISSKGDKSDFDLEIKLANPDNFVHTYYHIDKRETVLEFGISATEVILDPDYKLYRNLDNKEFVFNLKRTFLEKPILFVPQNSEQFPEIYNIGNTLRSNGITLDMMPLESINDYEWRNKALFYLGKHTDNPLFKMIQPYLPPTFVFGQNKFAYNGKEYSDSKYSLIINTKNPFAKGKSMSFWLWNSDSNIGNISAIFNYTIPSWVILEYNGEGFEEVAQGNLIDENFFPTRVNVTGSN